MTAPRLSIFLALAWLTLSGTIALAHSPATRKPTRSHSTAPHTKSKLQHRKASTNKPLAHPTIAGKATTVTAPKPITKPLAWKSVNVGLELAKQTGKPALVDVFTDWCGWCKILDRETLNDPTVAELISSQFVLIKCDAEDGGQGQALVTRLHVPQMYPLILVLDPDGQPKGGMVGFKVPELFKEKLAEIMSGNEKSPDIRIPSSKNPIPSDNPIPQENTISKEKPILQNEAADAPPEVQP